MNQTIKRKYFLLLVPNLPGNKKRQGRKWLGCQFSALSLYNSIVNGKTIRSQNISVLHNYECAA